LRVFPILVEDLHQLLDQVGVAEADAQLAALVEALGINVEGAEQGALFIGQDQLGVKVNALEFVDVDAQIL